MIFSLKTRYYAGIKGFLPAAILSLLCLWSITPNLIQAQSGHLSLVPVVDNCTAYVDMPLLFSASRTHRMSAPSPLNSILIPGPFRIHSSDPTMPGTSLNPSRISLQGPWGSHFR